MHLIKELRTGYNVQKNEKISKRAKKWKRLIKNWFTFFFSISIFLKTFKNLIMLKSKLLKRMFVWYYCVRSKFYWLILFQLILFLSNGCFVILSLKLFQSLLFLSNVCFVILSLKLFKLCYLAWSNLSLPKP